MVSLCCLPLSRRLITHSNLDGIFTSQNTSQPSGGQRGTGCPEPLGLHPGHWSGQWHERSCFWSPSLLLDLARRGLVGSAQAPGFKPLPNQSSCQPEHGQRGGGDGGILEQPCACLGFFLFQERVTRLGPPCSHWRLHAAVSGASRSCQGSSRSQVRAWKKSVGARRGTSCLRQLGTHLSFVPSALLIILVWTPSLLCGFPWCWTGRSAKLPGSQCLSSQSARD